MTALAVATIGWFSLWFGWNCQCDHKNKNAAKEQRIRSFAFRFSDAVRSVDQWFESMVKQLLSNFFFI